MTQNGISYVLNASNSCPKPDFICESRFMRIPINDNYCEKLLPWLDKSIEFIGERRVCLSLWGREAGSMGLGRGGEGVSVSVGQGGWLEGRVGRGKDYPWGHPALGSHPHHLP